MNKKLKLAVLATVLLFGTTTASATTSSRSSYKPSSYKSSSYKSTKPVTKAKPVKRKSSSSSEEIEYFALQDCQRHITLTFNGYRCIDRD